MRAGPILLMLFVALSCAFMGWAVVYLTAKVRSSRRRTSFGSERAGRSLPSRPRRTGAGRQLTRMRCSACNISSRGPRCREPSETTTLPRPVPSCCRGFSLANRSALKPPITAALYSDRRDSGDKSGEPLHRGPGARVSPTPGLPLAAAVAADIPFLPRRVACSGRNCPASPSPAGQSITAGLCFSCRRHIPFRLRSRDLLNESIALVRGTFRRTPLSRSAEQSFRSVTKRKDCPTPIGWRAIVL